MALLFGKRGVGGEGPEVGPRLVNGGGGADGASVRQARSRRRGAGGDRQSTVRRRARRASETGRRCASPWARVDNDGSARFSRRGLSHAISRGRSEATPSDTDPGSRRERRLQPDAGPWW